MKNKSLFSAIILTLVAQQTFAVGLALREVSAVTLLPTVSVVGSSASSKLSTLVNETNAQLAKSDAVEYKMAQAEGLNPRVEDYAKLSSVMRDASYKAQEQNVELNQDEVIDYIASIEN